MPIDRDTFDVISVVVVLLVFVGVCSLSTPFVFSLRNRAPKSIYYAPILVIVAAFAVSGLTNHFMVRYRNSKYGIEDTGILDKIGSDVKKKVVGGKDEAAEKKQPERYNRKFTTD